MASRMSYVGAIVAMLAVVLGACTRVATPTLTPSPAATPALSRPVAPAPNLSPEEAAWAKVVEAAKKEGMVTIYSTPFVADIGRRISDDFRRQFGIRVEILPGGGATLVERIKVEQSMKNQIADVYNTAGFSSAVSLVTQGRVEKIAHELPALRDKGVFKTNPVYSPGGEMVNSIIYYGGAPLINVDQVKPQDEPRSYKDLLAPRWKGKMITMDPRTEGGSSAFYYVLRYHKVMDLDYYRRLAQQDIAIWGGNPREMLGMVARGEYPITLGQTTTTVAPIMAEGAPLKILTMEEGTTISAGGSTLVVKGAPHPNAARVFVNWLLSPEGQLSYAQSASSTPIRKDVPDFVLPSVQMQPKIVWPSTWEASLWQDQDIAAKTMEKIFGAK